MSIQNYLGIIAVISLLLLNPLGAFQTAKLPQKLTCLGTDMLFQPSYVQDEQTTGFCDDFNDESLKPGWTWVDPNGDSSFSLTNSPHSLELSTPRGGHDLFLNLDAPRMIQRVTGDFVIRTKVAMIADYDYQGAGLLVWQDSNNYIRAELGGAPRAITMAYRIHGHYRHVHCGAYGFTSIFLRITRTGNTFSGEYSTDGVKWKPIYSVSYPAESSLYVGLHLINQWQNHPAKAYFDYFEINDCSGPEPAPEPNPKPPSISIKVYPPVTAPRGRLPVTWQIKGGNEVSTTYLMWDTSTHDYRNDYRYHTPAQDGDIGIYSDFINVPAHAEAIFMKPFAVVDGITIYGDREYIVPTRKAINVGGNQSGLDATHQYWDPDRESDFSPVWYEFKDGTRISSAEPISNTRDPWIYQSQRQGLSRFICWLGPNVYEMLLKVEFHFAELELDGPNQRVFDIYLEKDTPNEVVLRNVDVYALAGGRNTALTLTTNVKVNVIPGIDEYLTINFESPSGDQPILNGIVLQGINAISMYDFSRAVGAGNDDTYTDEYGTHLTSPHIYLGGNRQYHGGLRFPAIQIPPKATIRYAHLDVTAATDAFMNTKLAIYAHAHDSSPAFNCQGIVPNRPRTEHYVIWDLSDTNWYQDREYRSPELRDVIQEIVNRPGWHHSNALSLLLIAQEGDVSAPRKIWSFEGSYNKRAKLSVYYSRQEDIPTPTPTPFQALLPCILK
ncbi:MAG: DUF1349 domain-containing protein [Anaerolineae bacterium]|nr:DUF1349 domain-containing protein [Anaerolineae bacterium]